MDCFNCKYCSNAFFYRNDDGVMCLSSRFCILNDTIVYFDGVCTEYEKVQ